MQKFNKAERLHSRKAIGNLFSSGNIVFHYPFKLLWLDIDQDKEISCPAKMAVSVPRKNFKSAVKRNRLKRLIRESYRLNKSILYESLKKQDRKIVMMLIYISDKEFDFNYINRQIPVIIRKLINDATTGKDIL